VLNPDKTVQRVPWQTFAIGEHWYTHLPFQYAPGFGLPVDEGWMEPFFI